MALRPERVIPEPLAAVKEFFLTRVGSLLVPPIRRLAIQSRQVDIRPEA